MVVVVVVGGTVVLVVVDVGGVVVWVVVDVGGVVVLVPPQPARNRLRIMSIASVKNNIFFTFTFHSFHH